MTGSDNKIVYIPVFIMYTIINKNTIVASKCKHMGCAHWAATNENEVTMVVTIQIQGERANVKAKNGFHTAMKVTKDLKIHMGHHTKGVFNVRVRGGKVEIINKAKGW